MWLYLYKWPNGDFSIVLASSRTDALIQLDEAGDVMETGLIRLNPNSAFMVHFTNTAGHPTLEEFGELTLEVLESHGLLFDRGEEEPH